jgi:hypothetical protein
MPLLSTRGAATAKAFSSAQQTNWLAELILHFSDDYGQAIAVSPYNQNVVTVGGAFNTLTSSYYAGQIALINTNAVNTAKRTVGLVGGAFNVYFYDIAIDQNNFNYAAGTTSVYGNDHAYVMRFNTDLSLRYYRTVLGLTGTYVTSARSIEMDNSSNAYVAGLFNNSALGTSQALLYKLDVNGSVQWQKTLSGGPINFEGFYSVDIDSSNNVYVAGATYQTVSTTNGLVAKYNSSGTLQWQVSISGGSSAFLKGIKVNSSGDIYIGGVVGVSGSSAAFLAKLNSSGAIVWQRTLGGGGPISSFDDIALDNLGNIYGIGRTNINSGTAGYDYLIAKYNSSGVIQWQRTMGGSSFATNDFGYGIALDTNGNYYPIGSMYRYNYVSGTYNEDTVFAKLPNNGSLTGTYSLASTPLTYSSTSLPETAGSYSSSVISLTDLSSTLTESTASTITFYNSAQTYYSTYIP